MPSTSLSILLYLVSIMDRPLLVNVIGCIAVLCGASSHRQFMPSFICCTPAPKLYQMCQFLSIAIPFIVKFHACVFLNKCFGLV